MRPASTLEDRKSERHFRLERDRLGSGLGISGVEDRSLIEHESVHGVEFEVVLRRSAHGGDGWCGGGQVEVSQDGVDGSVLGEEGEEGERREEEQSALSGVGRGGR